MLRHKLVTVETDRLYRIGTGYADVGAVSPQWNTVLQESHRRIPVGPRARMAWQLHACDRQLPVIYSSGFHPHVVQVPGGGRDGRLGGSWVLENWDERRG